MWKWNVSKFENKKHSETDAYKKSSLYKRTNRNINVCTTNYYMSVWFKYLPRLFGAKNKSLLPT